MNNFKLRNQIFDTLMIINKEDNESIYNILDLFLDVLNDKQLKEIEDNNQIAINYCDENGKIEDQFNPNGSIKNIAGIFNKEKNVLGMMPHPERMIDTSLSGEDGSLFFKNLINNLK